MDRRILLFGRPPVPLSWKTLIIHTSTITWTVPKSGWYRIHVIGRGGNGGSGGSLKSHISPYDDLKEGTLGSSSTYSSGYTAAAGGGGGAGGYAVSVLYLRKGQQFNIEISAATIFPHPDGNIMASAGNNGTSGGGCIHNQVSKNLGTGKGIGSSGGTATGGNILNISGSSGTDGTNISYNVGGSTAYGPVPSRGGNGGGISGALISFSYGIGGAGGRGGYTYTVSTNIKGYYAKVSGSAGSGGAVIIEDAA